MMNTWALPWPARPVEAMVPEVLADTSGWAAYFIRGEPMHATAEMLIRRWRADHTPIVTTNHILAELVALMTSPLHVPRPAQVAIIETIRATPGVSVVHVDEALDSEAWALLKARPDKEWSLVDCTSFVLMRQRGIPEAFATDHHFAQAGFVPLLAT